MKKLIKRVSVLFLGILVVLNSLTLPGISSVLADEDAILESTVYVEETTEAASYEELLAEEPVVYEEPAAAETYSEWVPVYQEDTQDISDAWEGSEAADIADEPADSDGQRIISDDQMDEPENPEEVIEETSEDAEDETSEAEEKTEEKSDAEIENTMPAKIFTGLAGGVRVRVDAEEGTFPAGTEMKVKTVKSEEVFDQINDAVEGNVVAVKAVDITFYDKDGNEIQPEKEVKVTLQAEGMGDVSDKDIVHIDDEGNVDIIDNVETNGEKAKFDADSFSIYAVVETGEDARVLVKFVNGTEIASMYVKKGDNMEQVLYDPGVGQLEDDIIFKGWTTKENYTSEDADNALTIEGVREAFENGTWAEESSWDSVTDGTTVTYYAMLFYAYTVSYYDEEGTTIHTDTVFYKADDGEKLYTVNMQYTPKNPDANFEGWQPSSSTASHIAIADETQDDPVAYVNETEVKLSGSVVLNPYIPAGAWLSFNENGKGASYTPPQYIKSGEKTEEPTDPTRKGYSFGGWYTSAACLDGEEFTFNQELTTRTDIYAKWIANETARYTVVIWKQNVSGDGYDFEEAIVKNDGLVGANIDIVESHGSGTDAYVSVENVDKKYTGFHLEEFDQEVLITPEGSAILNIYYNRNTISLVFYVYGSESVEYYVESDSTSGTLYGLVDGEYIQLTRHGYYSPYTWTYPGEPGYVETDSNSGTQYGFINDQPVELIRDGSWWSGYTWLYATGNYTYTASNSNNENPTKYGYVNNEYVELYKSGNNWYVVETNERYRGTRYTREAETAVYTGQRYLYQTAEIDYTGQRYERRTSRWTKDETLTGLYGSSLGDNDYTWPTEHDWWSGHNDNGGTSGTRTTFLDAFLPTESQTVIEFYGSTPTSGNVVNFYKQKADGSGYELANSVNTSSGIPFSISDKYSGYKADHYSVDNGNPVQLGEKNSDGYYATGVYYNSRLDIYYNRATFKILYRDGGYFGANDLDDPITDEPNEGIWKEEDDIPYGEDIRSYASYKPTKEGYVFEGWFTDSSCSQEYTFTTMPDGGITVYAKWRLIQYRVFLHPNVPTEDESLVWGQTTQQTSFRVYYGEKISGGQMIAGERNDYELIGWYTDEACTKSFNFDAYPLNDNTVQTVYDKTRPTELDKYGNQTEPGNKDTNRFWITRSLDLYAKWRAKLEGANGIIVVYDDNGGSNAPTDPMLYSDSAEAIAQAASTPPESESEKQFAYWIIQKWDEASNSYKDTSKIVFPGDSYTVLKDNAKRVVTLWVNPNDSSDVSETEDDIHSKIKTATYTIKLKAHYIDPEQETPTHIYWFANMGQDAFQKDKNLAINKEVIIQDALTRDGYSFLGWARVDISTSEDPEIAAAEASEWEADSSNWTQPLSTSNVYLFYNEDNDNFHLTSTEGQTVTYIAADEETPYHAMFAVWQPNLEIRITGTSDTKTYTGNEQSVSGYTVEYQYPDHEWTTTAPTGVTVELKQGVTAEAKGTNYGDYYMGLSKDSFNITVSGFNFDSSTDLSVADGKLTIMKASLTITANAQEYTYNGSAQGENKATYTDASKVTVSGLQGSDALTSITLNGQETNAGEYTGKIVPSAAEIGNATDNYEISYVAGKLTITKAGLTITAKDQEYTYNGAAQGENNATYTDASKVTVSGLQGSDALTSIKLNGQETNAGEYTGKIVPSAAEVGTATDNYEISYVAGKLTIKAKKVTITADNASKTYDGSALTQPGFTASALEEGDTHTFTVVMTAASTITSVGTQDNVIATVDGVAVTTGTETVVGNYLVTTANGLLTVNPKKVTITANDASKTYDGSALTQPGFTASALEEGDTHTFTVVMTAASTITDAGTKPNVIATVDGVAVTTGTETVVGNYLVTTANGTLTISRKAVTIKAKDASKTYDSSALTQPEFTASALEEGDIHTFTVVMTEDSTITNVGTKPNVIATVDDIAVTTGTETVVGNYLVTTVEGTLTITNDNNAIIITSATTAWTYDSKLHKDETYMVTYGGETVAADEDEESAGKIFTLTNGDIITITATAAGVTNVSDNAEKNNTYTYTIKNGEGTDTSGNYSSITANVGTLSINRKSVTITAEGASKTYDGSALTESGFTTSGLEEGDTHTFTVVMTEASTITNVGTKPNVIATVDDVAVTTGTETAVGNYLVTTVNGTLKIDPKKVTITANDASKTYDGSALTESGFTATALESGDTHTFTVVMTAASTITNVGTQANVIATVDGEAVTAGTETAVGNYLVTTVNGTLKIDPKKVTITAEDAEKTYDGKALTQPGFTASALESGDTHTFTVVMTEASTITNIGTQANVIATVDGEAVTTGTETAVGNYLVTTENGELKVNPKKVTITANDAKKTYDGSALTESGFTASDLESGDRHTFAVVMTADSTITNVGTQPNVIATVDGVAVTTGTETAVGNYLVTTVNGELKIEKANLTVTITGNNASKPYNGSEQSVTGYKISIPQGATLTEGEIKGPEQTAAIAKGTNVDGGDNPDKTYPMGLTVDNFSTENGNYNVTFTVEDGWLKITPLETEVIVTITGHNDTKDYDGTEYSVSGYDVSINNDLYKEADFTFNGNAEAKRTNVVEGTDTDGKTDMGLNPDQFTNKNINFQTVTFKVTDGFQKINPIDVTVRIIGKSNTAPYDGKEHEVTGYTAIAENQLYDVEKDFTFSGSAKAKRTDVVEGTDTDGKTDMGLTESQFKNTNSNFGTVTFNIQDGYQEIEPIKVTVTITGHNNTTSYDGKEHVVKGYDVEISNPLYTEKDFTFNSTSEAKRTNVVEGEDTDGKTEMGLNADQFKNTNTNFDTVTFNVTDGYQIINPINVTVTIMGNYNAITFDGDEHIVTGFTATADSNLYKVEGDPVDFNFNGTAEAKRTDEGTTYMGLEDTMFSNKNTNFATVTFKVTDGYQTIVPIGEVLVTITGHNNTASYDGKEHVVKGYDVEISDPLYTEKDFTFSGTSEAKRTNVEEGEDTDGKTDMGLNKDQFENTSPNFTTVTFKVTDGYQIITPIDATVTITGKNNSTEYDGNEHSVSGYDVKIEGNLYKETDFTFTGTAEAKRTNVVEGEDTDGQTNMGLKDDQFTNQNTNFKTVIFKVTDGYQKITPIDVTVTIVGNQHTTDYDGEKHSVVGFTAKANSDLYSVEKEKEDFAFSGQALATRKDAGTTNMGLTEEQFTNKNTNFGTVTFKVTDGYQTINPIEATVTIVGANSTAPYDKKAHTVTGYTATADTELYDVLKDFTFGGTDSATRTDVGTTYMGLKDNQFTNVSANFKKVTFEVTDGYQKIEAIEVTVTITGKNATVTYDGKEHTVSGYNINSSNDLYTAADFTFSGSSELKEKNAGTYTMDLDAKDFKNTNDNFVVTFVIAENGDGKLVIDPKPITIKADDKTKVYGDKDPELTATIIGLVDGDSIDGDYIVSREKGEDVGEYKITISLPTIEQGAVFTLFKSAQPAASNYEIATEDGTFTITKAPLTISTESATKQYDGTALTKEGATITGLVKGETATVTATGKQTEVGSSSNTYTIVWDTAKESNYAITEQLGTLTVTETAVVPDNPPAPGVKTGDNTPITLWIVAFAVSATLIILLLILVIKRRKERE